MNHIPIDPNEFFKGVALAIPFIIAILLYANYKANTLITG